MDEERASQAPPLRAYGASTRAFMFTAAVVASLCGCSHAYMLPSRVLQQTSSIASLISKSGGLNYYEVLCIRPEASPVEIKRAYRERAKLYHPDLNPWVGVDDFLLIKEAYEVLSNSEARTAYDRKRAVGEAAELGMRAAEIIAMDMAVPLARDVALPLVKAAIQGIDKKVIKEFAEPFLRRTMEKSASIFEDIKQAAQERALEQAAAEAERRMQQMRQVEAQLRDFAAQMKKQQERTAKAATVLQQCMDFESHTKQRLKAEMLAAEQVREQSWALLEEREKIKVGLYKAAARESRFRSTLEILQQEDERVSLLEDTAQSLVEACRSELMEANELVRLAQLRLDAAEENYEQAQLYAAETKSTRTMTRAQLADCTTELSVAEQALMREQIKLDQLQGEQDELRQMDDNRKEAQRVLQTELGLAVRAREAAQKELLKAQQDALRYEKHFLSLTSKMDKSYMDFKMGDGTMNEVMTPESRASGDAAGEALTVGTPVATV